MKKRRIGIYPGTFDPIHSGHVALAVAAKQLCNLDEVVFLPELRPRSKHNATDIKHRIAMINKALRDLGGLSVERLQSEQFTVKHTLPELQALFADNSLFMLLGSDTARRLLHQWDDLDMLLESIELVVGLRTGDSPFEISAIMGELESQYGIPVRYTCIKTRHADITSSQVRTSAVDMTRLHPDILDYIAKHKLYAAD